MDADDLPLHVTKPSFPNEKDGFKCSELRGPDSNQQQSG